MEYLEAALKINYVNVILAIFLFLFAIKECLDVYTYFKKRYKIKTGSEQDRESIENRLTILEKHDKWQYNEISKISKGIEEIASRLDSAEEDTRKRIIIEYGADLYELHIKFMKQGYVTKAGLETFQSLADTYIASGGNHSIKGKIIPEVMSLPINDE